MFAPCRLSLNLTFCHATCGIQSWMCGRENGNFAPVTCILLYNSSCFLCLRRLNQTNSLNGKSRKWMNNNNKIKISATTQGRKTLHATMQTQTAMPCIASLNMQPINVHACPPEEVANMGSYSEDTWRLKQADTVPAGGWPWRRLLGKTRRQEKLW